MRVWKCKQVVDFDKSTTTVKDERNKLYNRKQQVSTIVFIPLHYQDNSIMDILDIFT